MLPRPHRLRRSVEIQRVLRAGRCITLAPVRVCLEPSVTKQTRVACVVGKSVDRSAVVRHRYQRWLREAARAWLTEQPSKEAYDMVWIARPGIKQVSSLAQLKDICLQLSTTPSGL